MPYLKPMPGTEAGFQEGGVDANVPNWDPGMCPTPLGNQVI